MERANLNFLALLIAIILLGSFLRIYGIERDSLWLDEYVSYEIASKPSFIEVYNSALLDNNPPLHYLILHIMTYFGSSEFILRMPSAIFGIAAIPVAYLIGRYYFGEMTGLIGAFLLSISYMHIKYSQEARMYTMLCFFAILSLYFFARALRENRNYLWLGFILSTLLGIYSHYYMLLAVFSYLMFYLVRWKAMDANANRRGFISSLTVIAILSIPLAMGFTQTISHKTSSSIKWGEPPSLTFIPAMYENFSIGILAFPIFILLFACGMWLSREKYRDEITLLGLYLLVPTLLSLPVAYLIDFAWRYTIFMLPAYLLIISRGIVEASRALGKPAAEVKGKRGKQVKAERTNRIFFASIIAILLIMGFSSFPPLLDYEQSLHKEDWRGIAAYLKNETGDGDAVILLPGIHYGPFTHYYNNSSDSTVLLVPANYTPAEIERLASGYSKTWYVLHYDINLVDPDGEVARWLQGNTTLEITSRAIQVLSQSRSKAAP